MKGPPLLLRVRFPSGDGTWRLWLPLFLLYPLLIALTIIALPLILIGSLVMWPVGKGRLILLGGVYFWDVLFNLRGLKVDVKDGSTGVLVDFI